MVKAGKTPELAYVGPKNKKVKTVKIPAVVKIDGVSYKVTAVADGALKNYKNLTKVTVGKNITKIGKNAFYSTGRYKGDFLVENIGLLDLDVSGASSLVYIGPPLIPRRTALCFAVSCSLHHISKSHQWSML